MSLAVVAAAASELEFPPEHQVLHFRLFEDIGRGELGKRVGAEMCEAQGFHELHENQSSSELVTFFLGHDVQHV